MFYQAEMFQSSYLGIFMEASSCRHALIIISSSPDLSPAGGATESCKLLIMTWSLVTSSIQEPTRSHHIITKDTPLKQEIT